MRTATYTPAEAAATVDRILTDGCAYDAPLTPDTTIAADLRADSLKMIEIAMDLEIALGIEVSDRSLDDVTTVAELHTLACALLRDQGRLTGEAA
jgi:acyl carrier protein